jgi:hypothetical protein
VVGAEAGERARVGMASSGGFFLATMSNHAQDASSRSLSNPLRCITLEHLRVCKRVDIYIYIYLTVCLYVSVYVSHVYIISVRVCCIYIFVCVTRSRCVPLTDL